MKNKIIKYIKYFFVLCFALSVFIGGSIMCYMIGLHAHDAISNWPKTDKAINICVGVGCFSGICLILYYFIDNFIINK
jgi:hypothetical protein